MKKIKIFLWVLSTLIVLSFVAGYTYFDRVNHVKSGHILIFEGATTKQIAFLLKENGIISSDYAFLAYVLYEQKMASSSPIIAFKAGEYTIEEGDFSTLIAQLNQGGESLVKSISVTFPEGKSLEEMALLLEEKGVVTSKAFLSYADDAKNYAEIQKLHPWLPILVPGIRHPLEGYLAADTYEFNKDESVVSLVEKMLSPVDSWYATYSFDSRKLLPFDRLISLASVVEKESKHEVDRPKVAQVFFNRLNVDMKLQSDATVIYALGKHKVLLTIADTQFKSPYNTYVNAGIPVGPICAPSKASFDAVMHPEGEAFKAIYFYARPTGETLYATTFADHEKNRIQYESEWKNVN
jgi:UPF0755 protein